MLFYGVKDSENRVKSEICVSKIVFLENIYFDYLHFCHNIVTFAPNFYYLFYIILANMKKLLASIAALLVSMFATSVSAQALFDEAENDYRIGVQLGFNVPSFGEDQFGSTVGWNIGATGLLNTEDFISNTYLRGAVLYTRKGASAGSETVNGVGFRDVTYYLHYTEIPVRFGYGYDTGNDICLFAETGPYLAMRWTGSFRAKGSTPDGSKLNCDVKDYYKDLRRFDIGWGLHAGMLYKQRFQVSVGYDWSFSDVIPSASNVSDGVGKNLNLNFNVAVFIN